MPPYIFDLRFSICDLNCNRKSPIANRGFRKGITAVLAMLYMALFSTLALGFYAAVTTSVQVASNEQSQTRAMRAAESGIAWPPPRTIRAGATR